MQIELHKLIYCTMFATSRATAVRMSAQETVLGHFFSKLALTSSMNSKPLRVLLVSAYFSLFCGMSSKTEASHPYT
jgi:hypothetical protein